MNQSRQRALRFVPPVLAVALVVAVVIAGNLLLQACGLRLPFVANAVSICDDGRAQALDARLAMLEENRSALQREIARYERDLADTQCQAALPAPVPDRADVLPPPAPEPEPAPPPQAELPSDPEGLDRNSFENRDIAVLEGCWDLDSNYSTQNIRTGRITDYTRWHMCFDDSGRGTQTMQGTDGSTCQGPVEGRFDDEGRLVIDDGAPLPCSSGSQIFRRVTTCLLDDTGRADCLSEQPFDTRGGSSDVGLRRAGDTL